MHYIQIARPDTKELRARASFVGQMVNSFNEDELIEICFNLKIKWDELEGDTIRRKAMALYQFAERRHELHRLVDICQEKRPLENWMVT